MTLAMVNVYSLPGTITRIGWRRIFEGRKTFTMFTTCRNYIIYNKLMLMNIVLPMFTKVRVVH
jgi:hypothetical protein